MTSISVSIITPCSRLENLPRMREFIPNDVEWIVVVDGDSLGDAPLANNVKYWLESGGVFGSSQRNLGIEKATGDYVYFLDDDNVLHPALLPRMNDLKPDRMVMFNQVIRNGFERLTSRYKVIEPCHCDTAQFFVPRDLIGDTRWAHQYAADGIFFKELSEKGDVMFLDENLCFYNYLR